MKNRKKSGLLIILPCHGVYDKSTKKIYSEHPEDQPIYEEQIRHTFKHFNMFKTRDPLLVISGGLSKKELKISESRSYLDYAKDLNLNIPNNLCLEECALNSTENMLFSIYIYFIKRKFFPEKIEIISWGFKKNRYKAILRAINNWSKLDVIFEKLYFISIGELNKEQLKYVKIEEKSYIDSLKKGLEYFYSNPIVMEKIIKRDVFNLRGFVYKSYPNLPLPWL